MEATGTHTFSRGLTAMLVGEDPMDIEGLWRTMYRGTIMDGRRGAVIHALGAIDMALWDLKGKALGKPVHELLGGAAKQEVYPYASLQPVAHTFEEYRDSLAAWARRARDLGFRAVKSEVTMNGPFAHAGLHEPYERHTEVVAAGSRRHRSRHGPDRDVQYLWEDAETALRTIRDWEEFDLFFLETPIWVDNLHEYARLHEEAPMRIACGELQATRFEFAELMDTARIDVAQPDVGRVGGLGEAMAVCRMAGSAAGLSCRTAGRPASPRPPPPISRSPSALPLLRVPAARALRRAPAQGTGRGGPRVRRRRGPSSDQAGARKSSSTGTRWSVSGRRRSDLSGAGAYDSRHTNELSELQEAPS